MNEHPPTKRSDLLSRAGIAWPPDDVPAGPGTLARRTRVLGFLLALTWIAGISDLGVIRNATAQGPDSIQAHLGFLESEPETYPLAQPELPLSRSDGSAFHVIRAPRSAFGITLVVQADADSKATVESSTAPDGKKLVRRAWSRMRGSGRLHMLSFGGLGFGENTIGLTVAAPGLSRTYLVTVTRAEVPGSDPTLTGLSFSEGGLTIPFASDETSYVATVPHSVSTVALAVRRKEAGTVVRLRGTSSEGEELAVDDLTVSGLAAGRNTIEIVATAEDGSNTETYAMSVVRLWPSKDTRVWDLSLAEGAAGSFGPVTPTGLGILRPAFRSDIRSYEASVSSRASRINMGILCPSQATLSQRGRAPDGTALEVRATDIELHSIQLDDVEMRDLRRRIVSVSGLQAGRNTIEIRVTAEDGVTTGVYQVTVNRG